MVRSEHRGGAVGISDRIHKFKNAHLALIPSPLVRTLALRRLARSDIGFPGVEFKIASSEEEMLGAFALLEKSYIKRGIARDGQMRLQVINLLPTSTTFVAKKDGKVIGTISLIEDSELGLPMEKVHTVEVRKARQLYRHVAEVGALAVEPEYRRSSLSLMLYNMMGRWARGWTHVDDLLIAVHPSAQFFYRSLLMFETMGKVQKYAGLRDASSLPMRLDFAGFQGLFQSVYKGRSPHFDFYDFLFAPNDRFDFSSHPTYRANSLHTGSLPGRVVSRILNESAVTPGKFAANEVAALSRYFPDCSLQFSGAPVAG